MKGTGRWYSPKCGLIGLNGDDKKDAGEVEVNRGDILRYHINGASFIGQCGLDSKSGVTEDDSH